MMRERGDEDDEEKREDEDEDDEEKREGYYIIWQITLIPPKCHLITLMWFRLYNRIYLIILYI